MAYVVLAAGHAPSPELGRELQDFVRSKIAKYKRPRWIEFVEALPKTATGKTQRFKLRQAASEAVYRCVISADSRQGPWRLSILGQSRECPLLRLRQLAPCHPADRWLR